MNCSKGNVTVWSWIEFLAVLDNHMQFNTQSSTEASPTFGESREKTSDGLNNQVMAYKGS
jgi:hypothetical protein